MRNITLCELEVGQPLPWDVYGEGGGLLARKGYLITNDNQIDNLIKRGMVVREPERDAADYVEPPSVLRMLNGANRCLEAILTEIAAGRARQAQARLEEVAQTVAESVKLCSEVALACILHNQQAGPYSVRHSIDTAIVSILAARALKKTPEEVKTITLAALTMNVGMLQEQERMQAMHEPLSITDVRFIRSHPEASVALLRAAGISDEAWLECVLSHHENENGSGYPNHKQADDIPGLAKIISLADRYCARVSARSYRKPMLPNAALRDILLEGKSTIDAQLAAVFIRELGVYPVGTYVRLLNGEIGVVTRKGVSSTTPIVDALVGPRGAPLENPIRRDTKEERLAIREVLCGAQADVMFNLDRLWGRVAAV